MRKVLALFVISAMLISTIPISVLADEEPVATEEAAEIDISEEGEGGSADNQESDEVKAETAPEETEEPLSAGKSNVESADVATESDPEETGEVQATSTESSGEEISATANATTTENIEEETAGASTTPSGAGGETGGEGESGESGGQTNATSSPSVVETGDSHSSGEINNDLNSNTISSTSTPDGSSDLDDFTLTSTGTNTGTAENLASTTATTGNNTASSTDGAAEITTGDAVSVLNIANVINTNVINSLGLLLLLNQLMGDSFDLRDFFFPTFDSYMNALSNPICSFTSCVADDVEYTVENTNIAEVTNSGVIRAVTGENEAEGETAGIATGNAYAGANLLNLLNTNIIDSNYLLVAMNGMGDLLGDLVFPNSSFFTAFFGQPNAFTIADETNINVDNNNTAEILNGTETDANTGDNLTFGENSTTTTGTAHSGINAINHINQNFFGGDSLYILIKVHGTWSGDVFGLPDGLSWEETPEGILIYSEGADIVPSERIRGTNLDEYDVNLANTNDALINNDMKIYALTGENKAQGTSTEIATGNAYAGANVFNIANTNVVGQNWVLAVFNIFGNFNGNISFGRPDLWVGGRVESSDNPVRPGSKLRYTYTVANNGDLAATNVTLAQQLGGAYMNYPEGGTGSERTAEIGRLGPGETRELSFEAEVNKDIPYGQIPVVATTTVRASESDNNRSDNTEVLALVAENAPPSSGGSSSRNGGSGTNVARTGSAKSAKDSDLPKLTITKTANAEGAVEPGDSVDYTIHIKNDGGRAYGAVLRDTLKSAGGLLVNTQEWELEEIKANEEILVTYTVSFTNETPNGDYINTAVLSANNKDGEVLSVSPATRTVAVGNSSALSIGNVTVTGTYAQAEGGAAVISWSTNMPADSRVVYSRADGGTALDPAAPNYGYSHTSQHLPLLTANHSVYIESGLAPGGTYIFRAISKAGGPEAISEEGTFTVPYVLTPFEPELVTLSSVEEPSGVSEELPPLMDGESEGSAALSAAPDEGGGSPPLPRPEASVALASTAFSDLFSDAVSLALLTLIVALLVIFAWSFETFYRSQMERRGNRLDVRKWVLTALTMAVSSGIIIYLLLVDESLRIPGFAGAVLLALWIAMRTSPKLGWFRFPASGRKENM